MEYTDYILKYKDPCVGEERKYGAKQSFVLN